MTNEEILNAITSIQGSPPIFEITGITLPSQPALIDLSFNGNVSMHYRYGLVSGHFIGNIISPNKIEGRWKEWFSVVPIPVTEGTGYFDIQGDKWSGEWKGDGLFAVPILGMPTPKGTWTIQFNLPTR